MLEFIFGILIGFFLGLVGIAIGAAAGPDDEFVDIYDDITD